MHTVFAPKYALLHTLTGNELHLEIQTDTEYDKKENTNHFGFKCQIMGFEWNSSYSKSLAIMEKELVTLSGMCCGKLLREGTLPWCGGFLCVCVCVCVCVRNGCVRVCVRACVRACVRIHIDWVCVKFVSLLRNPSFFKRPALIIAYVQYVDSVQMS